MPATIHQLAIEQRIVTLPAHPRPFRAACAACPASDFAYSAALLNCGRHISREPDVIMGRW
jgi:hypothetical protein